MLQTLLPVFLTNCIEAHRNGETRFVRIMQADVYDSVSILRRVNLIVVMRINLHLNDLLERTVVRYRYPKINLLCSGRNFLHQCFIFKLKPTLSWRIRWPRGLCWTAADEDKDCAADCGENQMRSLHHDERLAFFRLKKASASSGS